MVKPPDAIPDFQTLMLPVLKSGEKGEVSIKLVISNLAEEFCLTDDQRSTLLPSGKQTTFANRVHWAKTFLVKAGLLAPSKLGHSAITQRGLDILSSNPRRIDNKYLSQWPEFVEFRTAKVLGDTKPPASDVAELTPDERMRAAYSEINETLAHDLIERILALPPAFFEVVTVKLLVAMGYGGSLAQAGKALGKSGDGGVDGVIDEDELGLDRIYVQAKRYKADLAIGPGAIRDFFGALDQFKATKGLFVTTSYFSSSAIQTAAGLSKRIVLIDGKRLSELMLQHDVGCRVVEQMAVKRIDEDFFEI